MSSSLGARLLACCLLASRLDFWLFLSSFFRSQFFFSMSCSPAPPPVGDSGTGQPPSEPRVDTVAVAAPVGTGREGCDASPRPAAVPLLTDSYAIPELQLNLAGISDISRPYASQHSACSPESRSNLPSAPGSLDLSLTPPLHERIAAHSFEVNLTSSPTSSPDVASALDYILAQLPALSRPLVASPCSHISSSVHRSQSSAAVCSRDAILTSPSCELATA